jgi:glycosyltransferase involved in cell wall biosynthesis
LLPRLERLTADGGRLSVLTPGEGSLRRAYDQLGEVRPLSYEPLTVPRGPLEAVKAVRRLTHEIARFRAELRRTRPDLVVVVTAVLPAALIAARLERVPTIVYVGEIFAKGHVDGPLRALGGRLAARLTETFADRLVCCSQTVARQFRRPNAVTIYPGISEGFAQGDGGGFRARHGLEDASPLIAVVGNVCEGRAQDTAIRALSGVRERFPGARLAVAGLPHPRPRDEAFAAEVRALVGELGLEDTVTFTGFVEQVADAYAAADVVVNPARFSEPFGRVALEALVAQRPVVASRVGAIPEVLRDGTDALLVEPDDPRALADAVVRVLEEPGLAAELVTEGNRRARREFDEERGVGAFERVVEEVLDGRSDGAAGARP